MTREPTDGLLWARARAGDRDAFGRLYERHARAVYNYLFRRLADWSEAEDMTAVVFLEAWRRREVVVEEGMVRAWLFGIATNVARNRRRARRRHREALKRLSPPGEVSFADELPARLDAQRQMRGVLAAVAALPQEQRDVVALCIWSELSYEEAAHALGVPVGTIRSRLSRARGVLRELMAAPGHEEGMVRERHGALPG